jgi:beta-N-acetylhexosaminidase
MLLVCNNPSAAEQVLDSVAIRNNSDRQRRLSAMLGVAKLNRQQLFASEQWQQVSKQINQLCEAHA